MVDYISTSIPTQALFEMRANTAAPTRKCDVMNSSWSYNECFSTRLKPGRIAMDPNEAMGFFPERHRLRARRLRTEDDVPLDASDALTRRTATWMSVSVAVFTPPFSMAVIFGWISLKSSLEVALCASSCVLLCAILLGAQRLRRSRRHT